MAERTLVTLERINLVFGIPLKGRAIQTHLNNTELYPTDEAVEWLLTNDGKFAHNLRTGLSRFGALTPRQAEAVVNAAKRDADKAAQYAQRDAERAERSLPWSPVSAPYDLTLRVVTARLVYASASITEPTVKGVCRVVEPVEREGAAIWMTIPRAVRLACPDPLNPHGAVFKCRVKVMRGTLSDDPYFGLGSRPSNAEFLRIEKLEA